MLSMVYMNLQPPAGTARRSPAAWWSLTHTFSPLPRHFRKEAGRLFSSPLTSRRRLLLLSEVERPVLPGLSSRPTFQKGQRQTAAVLSFYFKVRLKSSRNRCKGRKNYRHREPFLKFCAKNLEVRNNCCTFAPAFERKCSFREIRGKFG